ncbi:nucleotidyltransferase domain-containing protein [Longispora albida]|uniref:nucleotidyltransferase domain-containing protein n=1 Tax=Longispora albida TaxID=203523 RepID=UPI00035F719F|nr:nucleotidyltransferase domain-containing protein [Longispora albida]
MNGFDLEAATILEVVVGSRVFGLETSASDTDRRGIFAAPASAFWGFTKPPTHVDGPLPEQFRWEVERFCELALVANPNVLEVLHSPLVERITPEGEELQALRPAFLSRRVAGTYLHYARAQFVKAQRGVERDGHPVWRHVTHLLRLLAEGKSLVETGVLTLSVGEEREFLLSVKRGEVPWAEVNRRQAALADGLEAALPRSPLPAEPDTRRVEEWLISLRRRSLTP